MAITFLEKRKIQKYFVLIFGATIFLIALIIWQGFFVEEKPVFPKEVSKSAKKIEIDFEILENPILRGLQPFEKIQPIEAIDEGIEIGRENPSPGSTE